MLVSVLTLVVNCRVSTTVVNRYLRFECVFSYSARVYLTEGHIIYPSSYHESCLLLHLLYGSLS